MNWPAFLKRRSPWLIPKEKLWPLLLFAVVALVVTWPLGLAPWAGIHETAFGRSHVWITWHCREAIFNGRSLLETQLINWPEGTSVVPINWLLILFGLAPGLGLANGLGAGRACTSICYSACSPAGI